MSQEAQAWAKQQRTGDPTTKAVLIELGNWARPTGIVEYLDVQRIADVVEVSARTVQRHLNILEKDLKLVRRISRRRHDGGRGANGFELVGFEPPLFAPPPRQSVTPPGDKMSWAPVTLVSPPGDTDVTPPGDTGVTRIGNKNIIPPISSNDDICPQGPKQTVGKKGKAKAQGGGNHRLPDDWTAPAIADLPETVREHVTLWPEGAYRLVAETFRQHFAAETGPRAVKADWPAAFAKWLLAGHGKVMRDAKGGVRFVDLATQQDGSSAARAVATHPMRDREDSRSAALRGRIRQELGDRISAYWFEQVALIFGQRFEVVVPSAFIASHLRETYGPALERWGREIAGQDFGDVVFLVRRVSHGAEEEEQEVGHSGSGDRAGAAG